jgi:hypothetical protein
MSSEKLSWDELHPKKKNGKKNKWKNTDLAMQSGAQFIDEAKSIQCCPNTNCAVQTQKIGGCNYIFCKNCKLEWCWFCHLSKILCKDPTHRSHS